MAKRKDRSHLLNRSPFQGVWQIIRFNWHFYALTIPAIIFIGLLIPRMEQEWLKLGLIAGVIYGVYNIISSLLISHIIYDRIDLYSANWLQELFPQAKAIAHFHSGFDEWSEIIQVAWPSSELHIFDFYDPIKHTEISIQRARKLYPQHDLCKPLNDWSDLTNLPKLDLALLLFSAHEIRDRKERIACFTRIASQLKPDGKILILEHQRNFTNFLAYGIGFLHFLSNEEWKRTFEGASLLKTHQFPYSWFIKATILKNGTTS